MSEQVAEHRMVTPPHTSPDGITEKLVLDYLRAHPEFLRTHPELLETLLPPERKLGRNVIDFQSYALGTLQRGMQDMKDKFQGLLSSARDNMSVQGQMQRAIMQLLKARDLEQFLEVVAQDFPRHFDVDTVRLVIESDLAEHYESYADASMVSCIRLMPVDTTDAALGIRQNIAMVADTQADPPYGYEWIFPDCMKMVQSCALLRIYLARIDRFGLLAFGSREQGRFHGHLGIELLQFLCDVIALRLDQCLSEQDIERLI